MNERQEGIPKLQRPGAGLPLVQEAALRHLLFPVMKRFVHWERARAYFVSEGRTILAEVHSVPPEQRRQRVLVPRMLGIEDSSRYWSLAMVLDHLLIVSTGVLDLMGRLSRGEAIDLVVDTAKVKPDPAPAADVESRFEALLDSFDSQLGRISKRNTPNCHIHPWFGCLNPHGWLLMLGVHQFIHRRQVAAIKRLL